MFSPFRILTPAAIMMLLAAPPARADILTQDDKVGIDGKRIFTVNVENDIFAGTDRNYTNGFRASVLSAEEEVPRWAHRAADVMMPFSINGKRRISFAVGQSMFTPRDLSQRTLIRDDRPYAGWLYGTVGLLSDTGTTLDNVTLTLGTVGPNSLAKPTQTLVHKLIDADHPYGWDNQIKNEVGVVLGYERKWRGLYQVTPGGAGVDITPHLGVNLGNINTDASIGAALRLGYDLQADYGPPRIRPSLPGSDFFIPSKKLGGYLFAGVEGRAVGRNIFLDGNTFRDSHSVDKEPLLGTLQAGLALTYSQTRLTYTHVFMTREFEGQYKPSRFGALSLSVRF